MVIAYAAIREKILRQRKFWDRNIAIAFAQLWPRAEPPFGETPGLHSRSRVGNGAHRVHGSPAGASRFGITHPAPGSERKVERGPTVRPASRSANHEPRFVVLDSHRATHGSCLLTAGTDYQARLCFLSRPFPTIKQCFEGWTFREGGPSRRPRRGRRRRELREAPNSQQSQNHVTIDKNAYANCRL